MAPQLFENRFAQYGTYINGPYIRFLRRIGLAIDFRRAKGCLVYDSEGNSYVDCIAGYGNCNIGHNHPRVIEAVVNEISSGRPYNLPFISDAQTVLSEKLAQITPGDLECSLMVNSGSEAVESALKLGRLVTNRRGVIATDGAWHGFTAGAMSVSERSICAQFLPLLEDITHVPFNDIDAFADALTDSVGTVIVEPIQSESGAIVADPDYLRSLAGLCSSKNVLLVFDEVKTGIGKTGSYFACEESGVVPDIILAGKSLGGGLMPIGTMTAKRRIWNKLGYSFPMSSSSSGGNAPACAAAVATLDVVETENLCENSRAKGALLLHDLQDIVSRSGGLLTGISGRGLLVSLHCIDAQTALEIVAKCINRKVLVMLAFCNRSRILIEPPLSITEAELSRVIEAIDESVSCTL